VIKEVLKKEFKKIMYYVCDFNSQIFAPETFVMAILTCLDFRSYEVGQRIIKKGSSVSHMNFIKKG